jgi:hypothetical protein
MKRVLQNKVTVLNNLHRFAKTFSMSNDISVLNSTRPTDIIVEILGCDNIWAQDCSKYLESVNNYYKVMPLYEATVYQLAKCYQNEKQYVRGMMNVYNGHIPVKMASQITQRFNDLVTQLTDIEH